MSTTDLVGASRDGDLFHYYWAARRSLELLIPSTDMVAISIEGAGPEEAAGSDETADEIIDVAEYYGTTRLDQGGRAVYRQLKHSTFQQDELWTLSGLKNTLQKFARRYLELKRRPVPAHHAATYVFVSNRVVAQTTIDAVNDVAKGATPRDPAAVRLLRKYLALDVDDAAEFCQRFSVDARAPFVLPLMRQYRADVDRFLPESDPDAALRLKEAVAVRATTLDYTPITRVDVLASLGVPEDQFFPALPMFEAPAALIRRECYVEIGREITAASGAIIVHASGGVGKSVFAQSMTQFLPDDAVVVVYDCYGLGSYRRLSGYRHAPRQGLVQIANELAARDLCDPLLPVANRDEGSYFRAFNARLARAADTVAPNLLVIAVDAADNAAMAAEEADGSRSFVTDLLREKLPQNVRLVVLCRTERIYRLQAPPGTPESPMPALDAGESKTRLEQKYGQVAELDSLEFHRKTAGNPRVQDEAMDKPLDVETCLSALGEGYKSADTAFDDLLDKNFQEALEKHGSDGDKVRAISSVLATLRPRIPLAVIADLADAHSSLVLSFVSDLGRPLLFQGDAVQFRDEPTESWFRTRFRASGASVTAMTAKLRALAAREAYAATSLPQLLWETDALDELVELALSRDSLPSSNSIERREIEEQRVQFALKASLRAERHPDAAKLAFKAGELAAGRSRHVSMIRANTDLSGEFLDQKTVEEIVASRALREGWPGSNLAYEGALMSFNPASKEDARNRLRSAEEWMVGWSRASRDEDDRDDIKLEDFAELAMGRLNVEGPEACVRFLERPRPAQIAFRVGQIVAGRLAERGDTRSLNAFLAAAKSNKYLQLAIAGKAMENYVRLDDEASRPIGRMLKRHKKRILAAKRWDDDHEHLLAICGALVVSLKAKTVTREEALRILGLYLPEGPAPSIASRSVGRSDPVLRAMALRAYCAGVDLTVEQVTPSELLDELQGKSHTSTQDGQEYRDDIVPLLPWIQMWIRVMCTPDSDSSAELEPFLEKFPTARRRVDYSPQLLLNTVVKISASVAAEGVDKAAEDVLKGWLVKMSSDMWLGSGWTAIRLLAALSGWDSTLFEIAGVLAGRSTENPEDPQFRVDALLDLARAVRPLSREEAQSYFGEALVIAGKLGDEAHSRWEATLAVATTMAGSEPDDERAFRLARLVEAIHPYLGDGYYAPKAVAALRALSWRGALATISRWRDRRFADFEKTVAALLEDDESAAGGTPQELIVLSAFVDAFGQTAGAFDKLVTLDETLETALTDFEADLRRERGLSSASEPVATVVGSSLGRSVSWLDPDPDPKREAHLADVASRLRSLDFTNDEGLREAVLIVRHERYFYRELATFAFDRPKRHWAKVIGAFSRSSDLSIFDYRSLFEYVEKLEGRPAGVRDALASLVDDLATRFSGEVATSRREGLPWGAVERTSGRSRAPVLATSLKVLGSSSQLLDATECYGVLMNLTTKLNDTEARAVFDYVEDSSRYLIDKDAPDREWVKHLAPPDSNPAALAGLIWAALGDPDESTRWRAAHAVRNLARLGCPKELGFLNDFAMAGTPSAFVDSRFVFYRDDAVLWLMISLDRIAAHAPDAVGQFLPLLGALSLSDPNHAMIALHLESILRSLSKSSSAPTADRATALLDARTWSRPEPVTATYSDRAHHGRSKYGDSDAPYQFDYDFRDNWINPLAECFGSDPLDLEFSVSAQIESAWGNRFVGKHDEDARWTKGVFKQGETITRFSDERRTHDLDSHLSFHALMRVAGELSAELPAYRDPDNVLDDFTEWLQRQGLSRLDGRWLSDRRDPAPRDRASFGSADFDRDAWRWSVRPEDFLKALGLPSAGHVTVWETSSLDEQLRSQRVRIESALVGRDRAMALLEALQTAPRESDFRIPEADSELEISEEPYVLRGWITDRSRALALDRSDPFSGEVPFPSPRPSQFVQDALSISADQDLRYWTEKDSALPPSMTVLTWGTGAADGRGRRAGAKGDRVQITDAALDKMLEATGMDLIVNVSLDRETYDYSGRNEDPPSYEIGYLDDYFKIFLYRPTVGWFDLHGLLPIR